MSSDVGSRAARVKRYQKRAAELRDMADNARDPEVRAELRQIARQYEILAEDVGGSDRGG